MKLDEEFIEEITELVENILDERKDITTEDVFQGIKNKWNEERVQKTESMLNGYKGLKDFVNTVNFTDKEYEKMEIQQIKEIMKNNFTENESFLERVYRSKVNTEILVNFLTTIFDDYIDEKMDSRVIADIRKAQMLKEMYMEGIKPSEVKLGYSSPKTFYKDKEELIDELAPKLLGVYGIKFSEKEL